jgi:hypothetical protein
MGATTTRALIENCPLVERVIELGDRNVLKTRSGSSPLDGLTFTHA